MLYKGCERIRMLYLIIFAIIILTIVSFTVFSKKIDELMGLIDSIEESINKLCEKENTKQGD